MKILLVRLSSLGDVLHTLPALTDLQTARPDIELHWLLEPDFAAVAGWHPAVAKVIPFSLRQLKERWTAAPTALRALRQALRAEHYDAVLDSQGLYKSALLARLSGAPVYGLDRRSAREPGTSRLYQRRYAVAWQQTAISRNRQLFAQALHYPLPAGAPDYGLQALAQTWRELAPASSWSEQILQPFVMGFHATSRAWRNKEWPVAHWRNLAARLQIQGLRLLLPAQGEREQKRVAEIAKDNANVVLLPAVSLEELGKAMVRAQAFVGMDTGLSYVAAALSLPGLTLYGPTAAEQSGDALHWPVLRSGEFCSPCGEARCQRRDRAPDTIPCQESLLPEQVWMCLAPLWDSDHAPY